MNPKPNPTSVQSIIDHETNLDEDSCQVLEANLDPEDNYSDVEQNSDPEINDNNPQQNINVPSQSKGEPVADKSTIFFDRVSKFGNIIGSRLHEWVPITNTEIRKFLGSVAWMRLVKNPEKWRCSYQKIC